MRVIIFRLICRNEFPEGIFREYAVTVAVVKRRKRRAPERGLEPASVSGPTRVRSLPTARLCGPRTASGFRPRGPVHDESGRRARSGPWPGTARKILRSGIRGLFRSTATAVRASVQYVLPPIPHPARSDRRRPEYWP